MLSDNGIDHALLSLAAMHVGRPACAVTPAYSNDGFYRIGDAGRLIDEARPEAGIAFDGRVAEDFKLASGTWVSVGTLRLQIVSALSPLAQDVVLTGHDRDEIGALVFPTPTAAAMPVGALHAAMRDKLAAMNAAAAGASSQTVKRAAVLDEPPSLDAGEITDKGYVNQRAVLERRSAAVQALYGSEGDGVVRLEAGR